MADDRRPGPVFVGGADRSGTTLMYALLDAHPSLCMVRRTNYWRWFDGRYGDLADPANLDRCLDELVRYRRVAVLDPDAERLRRELADGPATYARLYDLLLRHHAERHGASRWGDKSLHSEHHAGRILTAFPDARMVQMVRDPRDRYLSVVHRPDAAHPGLGAIVGRWRASVRAGLAAQRRHPDRYLLVRYEDLVRAPEATMARVWALVGEPGPAPGLLADGPASAGNSSFGDVGRTISTRAVGRWRRGLDPVEVREVDLLCGRLLGRLGYEASAASLTAHERRTLARDLPEQALRMAGSRALEWQARHRRGPAVPRARLAPVRTMEEPA